MDIIYAKYNIYKTIRIISRSQRYNKCEKYQFFVLLVVVCWCTNISNSWQHEQHQQHSYGGHFVGEDEAEAIVAIESSIRLAKIPCNFTTKTNCIYAEKFKLNSPFKETNEIVVSWVPPHHTGVLNDSDYHRKNGYNINNIHINTNASDNNNNVLTKSENDVYNFNWIFELLACMMLASVFEICLLILRNLRNISLTLFGFWSTLNIRLQMLCFANAVSTASINNNDNMRKRNAAMGEKRTLSYIFAILTWRASQTAKGSVSNTEANLRDDNTNSSISYGHVTTMGDLLLLILFTHVYYQRQKFQQETGDNKINTDPEDLLEGPKREDQTNAAYQKLYDKQSSNNIFTDSNRCKRNINKRCSHFCGNMYQQISSLQEHKSAQVKLTPLTNYTTKIPYLTYCTGIVWYTCCFCQYSYRSCCYCFSTCRRWNQRCYVYIPPLCNTIYCCCFYKSLKFFHDVNYQYCCYLCCWQDFCHINYSGPHLTYRCCCCFYCERLYDHCYLCNPLITNKMVVPSKALLSRLLNTIDGLSTNIYWPSSTNDYYMWKLNYNNQKYSIVYDINGQKYSLIYLADGRPMCVNNRNYYKVAVDIFSSIMPQYLVTLKNYQTFLKWKKLHVAVLVMALIVICASSTGANYDHHHRYYCSLFNKYHKHFCKCKQNKRRRRRRRRRLQHCKAYRPQHYFYATLMSCVVRRQHKKRLHKKMINKFCKTSTKLMTSNTTAVYEYTLASSTATMPMRNPMVRTVRRVRGSKPNIVWLIIGLIWFEGPKIVNCNVIINYQNQQQHEQQHQQQQQQHQQTGNNHKETTATTNSVNSNFEYKIENFNQMKTKNNNNNSNSNNSNSSTNNNKNKNKNSNNNSNAGNNRSSTTNNSSNNHNNIQLSVNLIPIFNTIHFKQYCNSNYHQKFIRSSQRFQRALKANPNNLDTSITPSASLKHNSINDDFGSEQLSSSEFQNINEENHAQSDLMRLESIKHQILFKLGLTRKPNVSHPLPKQFIWDTIYRADGIRSFHDFSNPNNFHGHEQFVSSHRSSPYLSAGSNMKGANTEPINYQHQKQHRHKNKEGLDNIKRSLESGNTGRKKYSKNKQNQRQTLTKPYNNNDVNYQKGATTASINLNQLLYTSNRNKLNHTNKMVNNFIILKQSKHQQIHKNSQHSTTGKKTTTIHQQQQNRRQHEQINQHTNKLINSINFQNNKIITNNKNNINNNGNNVNNSNNNIIVVQKQLHSTNNNNKYSEEAKKFTYLTDINSNSDDDDNLNNMEESHNHLNFDDNNSIVRKQQKQHNILLNEKVSENDKHFINIDNDDTDDGGSVDFDINTEHNIFHDDDDGVNDDEDDGNYNHYNQNHHTSNENRYPKFENFDENDDFFGSTQEIITFAEKGKMYKNHRLVEFSHQNNENPKQKLHVRNAEIHIRIDKISIRNKSRAGSGIKRKRLKIWIFQLIENNYTYKGFDHVAQFCASFEVDTSRLGWKKFDITSTVKEWYSRREGEKLRLLIDCTGCGKMYAVHLFNSNNDKADISIRERRIADETRYKTITDIQSKNFYNVTNTYENQHLNFPYNQTIVVKNKGDTASKNSNINSAATEEEDLLNSSRPFLVLHTEARKQRRVRRRAINCNGALHGQCCKESFYVSFKALGWDDWIIAPRGYFANYCRGDCTGPYRTPDTFQTFHAHFIEEYRKMGLLNGMQPCCAPIKFSSMSLIYYGDEGIIKRDLPKMVVDECGCP